MESWRYVWRNGIAPLLNDEQLYALLGGLVNDDSSLIQGQTTNPPPLLSMADEPCRGGCLVAYALWKGTEKTVGEIELEFARIYFDCGSQLGDQDAIRYFLSWFDRAPRREAIDSMIGEAAESLRGRGLDVPVDVCPSAAA